MLVPLMIQWTENTLIDGERVMYPYLGSMWEMRDCIVPLDADMVKEIASRESVLRPLQFPTLTGQKGNTVAPGIKSTLQYYYTACRYCWSSQFLTREWNAYGNTLS